MRIGKFVIVVAAAAGLFACMKHVDTQQAAAIHKVGILSITMDKIGTSPSDLSVLQRAVDGAPGPWEAALKTANPAWEIVPFASYKDNPAYRDFLAADSPVINEMAGKSAQMKMAAMMLHPEGGPSGMVIRWVGGQAGSLVGTAGMPLVPYVAASPKGTTSTQQSGKMTTTTNDQGMHDFFDQSIGALASRLGLDAMAVVYLHSEIKATVGINTIVNDRGIDSVRMKPTMLLINAGGKTVIDMGEPVIDDLSQRSVGAPVYKLDYKPSGHHKDEKGRAFDLVVDLNDPHGKVLPDLQDLIARTAQTTGEKIAKALTPPAK